VDLGLSGKACIVTGATSGIGAEVTRMLRAEGADVLGVARTSGDFQADVTDLDAAERIVAACESAFGRVDVLVNAAGTSDVMALADLTDEEWELQWQLNVIGPMRLMRAAIPRMAERGWGRVVNVASSAGKRPSMRNVAYTVTKAAELSLSRVYSEVYAKQGVLVNAICPGPVRSELWMEPGGLLDQAMESGGFASREEALESVGAGRPIGRLAEPGEIADAIVFLCSERASYIAGSAWSVDGGSVPVII
jgi:3-oxoacyl-[acyl-carrier protein] reductase